jgi:hypothetical protein
MFFIQWFHGVMVSTLDSESSDPSSNLGGTLLFIRDTMADTRNISLGNTLKLHCAFALKKSHNYRWFLLQKMLL